MIKTNRGFLLALLGVATGFVVGYWLMRRRAAWLELAQPTEPLWLPAQPLPYQPPTADPLPAAPAPPAAEVDDAPDDMPDDLTAIDGIGPAYASALHALGITTFAQLAASNPDDLAARIERLTAARIRRDDWLGQAAKLSQS
jgi:predicted flap endonuclease-1-like 5' DNA nuclease